VTGLSVAEVFSHALRGEVCHLTTPGEYRLELPVADWRRPSDAGDELLLRWCDGATLDVGCGPGRLIAELAVRGHVALGIDIVAEAIEQSRSRGAAALERDVFAPVPGEGRWETALLADGNIGIGGDATTLLDRIRRILRPGGRLVVETAPPGQRSSTVVARLECPCGHSGAFPWSVVSIDDLARMAQPAALVEVARESAGGRWVAVLMESPR